MAEIARKITAKSLGFGKGAIQALMPKDKDGNFIAGDDVELYKVAGNVTQFKIGANADGKPWIKLIGQFQAVRSDTGEVYVGAEAFLPGYVAEQIAEALKAGSQSIEFAFAILARPNPTAVVNYEFVAKPLIEIKTPDALANLLSRAGMAKIAAPTESSTPETPADNVASIEKGIEAMKAEEVKAKSKKAA